MTDKTTSNARCEEAATGLIRLWLNNAESSGVIEEQLAWIGCEDADPTKVTAIIEGWIDGQ